MPQTLFPTAALRAALLGVLCGLASACGAPVKSATDVAAIFSGDAVTLPAKLQGLCTLLRTRNQEPTLRNSVLTADGCNDAGAAAVNLQGLDRLLFLGLDNAQSQGTDKLIHFGLRSELWLNKGLLSIASSIATKLNARSGQDNKGVLSLPDGLGSAGGPIQFQVTVIEDPKIDKQTLSFSMKMNFKAAGIVDIDNNFAITAQLLDNKLAMHVKTTEDKPFETSLLKNAEALITVIPHAGDVYLDALIDANIFSPLGVADEALKTKTHDLISGMLKPAIDGLLDLNTQGGG